MGGSERGFQAAGKIGSWLQLLLPQYVKPD